MTDNPLLTPQRTGDDAAFMAAKIATARFYGDHILSKAQGIRDSIVDGAEGTLAMPLESF